jgi:hypothetical protein
MNNANQIVVVFIGVVNELISSMNRNLVEQEVDMRFGYISLKHPPLYTNPIYEVCYNYYLELKEIPFLYISFEEEIRTIGPYHIFAFNSVHNLFYGIHSVSQEIHQLDYGTGNIIYRTAKDSDCFMKMVCCLLEKERYSFDEKNNKTINNEDWLKKTINGAGGNEYSSFLEFISNG